MDNNKRKQNQVKKNKYKKNVAINVAIKNYYKYYL